LRAGKATQYEKSWLMMATSPLPITVQPLKCEPALNVW